jgi:hypothetical protein
VSEHIREELLALYVGGELWASEAGAVTQHLAECPECSRITEEFFSLRPLLQDSLPGPDDEDLLAVRSAVLAQIRQPRRRLLFACAAGTVAAGLAAVGIFLPARKPVPERSLELAAAPDIQSMPLELRSRLNDVDLHLHANQRRMPAKSSPFEGAVLAYNREGTPELKVQTADPSVVVILQLERKGEAQ